MWFDPWLCQPVVAFDHGNGDLGNYVPPRRSPFVREGTLALPRPGVRRGCKYLVCQPPAGPITDSPAALEFEGQADEVTRVVDNLSYRTFGHARIILDGGWITHAFFASRSQWRDERVGAVRASVYG